MNQNQLLRSGKDRLKQAKIEEIEVRAKRLLGFVLKQSREEFIRNALEEVSNAQEEEFQTKLTEIIEGKPLQYITHSQEFMGLNFYVDENVLIPQPDTEILVEQAIKKIKTIDKPIRIWDLCTGSGVIAISIAKQLQLNEQQDRQAYLKNEYQIIATDISEKALEVAKKNAMQNQVQDKIQFIQANMFEDIQENNFDVIVSNPPYIETNVIETLSKEVQKEPKIALDGGKDGLAFYRVIIENASNYLKKGGYVLIEIGYDQGEKIRNLWQESKKCKLQLITEKPIKDLGGNDRVMEFQYQ